MIDRKLISTMLAVAVVLTLPSAVGAQAVDAHAGHQHPGMAVAAMEPSQTATPSVQERCQAMRQRMQEIRATLDPDKRRQLLEAQMKDMEALLDAGACPLAGGGMMSGQERQGMMGRGMQHHGMGAAACSTAGADMGTQAQPGGGMMSGRERQGMMGRGMMGRGMQPHGMGGGGMQHGRGGHGHTGTDDALERRLEALEKRVDLLQMLLEMQAR